MSWRESILERRIALSRSPGLVGLEYVELDSSAREPGRPRLLLHFVPSDRDDAERSAVPRGITPANIHIADRSGGPATGIRVAQVMPTIGPSILPVALRVDEDAQLAAREGEQYTLGLRDLPSIDPFFRSRPFWLAPAPFSEPHARPAGRLRELGPGTPEIDYLVKDYASFRRAMLDQLTVLAPSWTEQGPADMGTAIVEVLAYTADYLSYFQDAAATEAYLGTARQRVSIRRHARLLGYALHEGCNARCWAQFTVDGDDPVAVPAGTQLLTGSPSSTESVLVPANSRVHADLLAQGAEVFETLYPTVLRKAHNRLSIYTWGARDWTLAAGSSHVAVVGHYPDLREGDALILEGAGGDARRRCVVRLSAAPALTVDALYGVPITELNWFADDVPSIDLPVCRSEAGRLLTDLTVISGNVVLADHGRSVGPETLGVVLVDRVYRPTLRQPHVVFSQPLEWQMLHSTPATRLQVQDPREALPSVRLIQRDGASTVAWQPQPDLLRSDRFAPDFVVEVDNHHRAELRFGDGVVGSQPTPGSEFIASYRVQGGPRGDIDADSLGYIIGDDPRLVAVRNPLPAQPGLAPEAVDDARVDAPQLLMSRATCVTEGDYSTAARQHVQVLNAVTRLLWSGGKYVACVYVQRSGGRPVDAEFSEVLEQYLQPHLLAGISVEIRAPMLVPLSIRLRVEVEREHYRSSVGRRLDQLAAEYFHPDAFTFGQSVYLSPLVAAVSGIEGVNSVDWLQHGQFQRWNKPPNGELEAGCIKLGPLEIARVANAPGAPSLGILEFELRGGR